MRIIDYLLILALLFGVLVLVKLLPGISPKWGYLIIVVTFLFTLLNRNFKKNRK